MKAARLLALTCAVSGCAHEASPAQVVARYGAALREGRLERAYVLTTKRYRATHDLPEFAAQVARQPIPAGRVLAPQVAVHVTDAEGGLLLVGTDATHLQPTSDPLDAYPHDDPESALRSFVRAVEHDRRGELLRLLAPSLLSRTPFDLARPVPPAFVEIARHIRDRIVPNAGIAPPLLQLESGRARLLIDEDDSVGLVETQLGWQLADLP